MVLKISKYFKEKEFVGQVALQVIQFSNTSVILSLSY